MADNLKQKAKDSLRRKVSRGSTRGSASERRMFDLFSEFFDEFLTKVQLPQVNVPQPKIEVTVPRPEITVNVPEIKIPEITMPEVRIPDIVVPKVVIPNIVVPEPKVTVNVPKVDTPEINFPEFPTPPDVQKILAVDVAGKPITPSSGGGSAPRAVKATLQDSNANIGTVSTDSQKTAFGELSVAEPTPVVQVQFPYNLNEDIWEVRDNKGSSSVADNMANLSTGASSNQSSTILSRTPIKYNPGQGALCRFTAIYTTGVANSTQYAGIGTEMDGYFFGYSGDTFGILRRQGGRPETRQLEITTKSTDADSITITLDGDTKAITVTDATATDATTTANEIAATDFSDVGDGWEVHAMGDKVFFASYHDGSKTGTYSLTDATSAVGTFTQSLSGVTVTETVVAQSSWSEDKCDGTGPSGTTCDFTKGNVFQIDYQWLGFGNIDFLITSPSTGQFTLVHRIEYANANVVPSVDNPTLPLYASVHNVSNTSDMILKIGSMGGFVEGRDILPGLPKSLSVEKASIGTTETPVMTIHSHDIYKSTINRVKVKMTLSSVSVEGTKPATIRIRKNPILVAGSFSPVSSNTSTVHKDTSATAVSGGTIVYSQSIEKIGHAFIDLEKIGLALVAPDFLTLSIEASSGTVDTVSTFNWQELF